MNIVFMLGCRLVYGKAWEKLKKGKGKGKGNSEPYDEMFRKNWRAWM